MKYELQIVFVHTKPKLEPMFYADLTFAQYQKLIEGYKGLYHLELDDADPDELDRVLRVKCYAMPKDKKKRSKVYDD